jgi:hypothetical protein
MKLEEEAVLPQKGCLLEDADKSITVRPAVQIFQ